MSASVFRNLNQDAAVNHRGNPTCRKLKLEACNVPRPSAVDRQDTLKCPWNCEEFVILISVSISVTLPPIAFVPPELHTLRSVRR
ncbi:hypothetical protein MAP00_007892 [Monascus purpureus]|nr:hypothetical protein MAP00_007892 [Monascus purpureus]